MEVTGTVANVLAQKTQNIWSIAPKAMVFEAIQLMAEKNVGSIIVLDGDQLVGIISERDYTRNVVLKGKSSRETPIEEIMTRNIITVTDQTGIGECMRVMTEKRVRHLPVLENGKVVGMVSAGDVMKWTLAAQTATINQLQSYITGGY